MSNDFAAIISTIYITVLIVGSVQHYLLIRRFATPFLDSIPQNTALRAEIIERMKATGSNPTRDELAAVHEGDRMDNLPPFVYIAAAGSGLWMILCLVIITAQIKVLEWMALWGAVEDPPPAARLTDGCVTVASLAIIAVVVEAIAHGLIPLLQMAQNNQKVWDRLPSVQAREFARLLADYRASLATPPDPSSGGS
ncbi:hypothetical protein OH738_40655 (plasmid) [Streptomyces hirsutus]|uniref:hypothetical protein n=1 Tax=Streptomyces hirsutus TaxID=35620 RepID=UPI002F9129C3|nr:hypothetical protein OH738_40655 [Streptomyces hirsutus]